MCLRNLDKEDINKISLVQQNLMLNVTVRYVGTTQTVKMEKNQHAHHIIVKLVTKI